jgi:ribosomal protein S12
MQISGKTKKDRKYNGKGQKHKQSPLIYHTEKQGLVTLIPTIQTITPNIPHRKTRVGNLDPNIQTITPNIPHRKTKAGNHDPNIQTITPNIPHRKNKGW